MVGELLVRESGRKFIINNEQNTNYLDSFSRIFASSGAIYKSLIKNDEKLKVLLNALFINIDEKMNQA